MSANKEIVESAPEQDDELANEQYWWVQQNQDDEFIEQNAGD